MKDVGRIYGRIKIYYGEVCRLRLGFTLCSGKADGKVDKDTLVLAIKQADKECGSCGCDFDPLYKRALELI